MAIDGFHVNGTALVSTGTAGGNSLEVCGYTVDGVQVEFTHNVAEIFTDVFGPMTPHDFQDMGEVAVITADFIATDRAVLSRAMNRGDKSSPGLLNTPGLVLGAGGYCFPLYIASPADVGWFFYRCLLRPASRVKLGTKASPFTQQFFAFPSATYQTVSGRNAQFYVRS